MRALALAGLGVLTLALVWFEPLPWLPEGAFSAHMTKHVAVVAAAAPLIALGIAGTVLDPVVRAPRVLAPIPASIAELVVVWAWHTPSLHHAARASTIGLALEQGSFLVCALLVWITAFGGAPGPRADRAPAGVVALLLTFMHLTLLGALLALAPRPLYEHAPTGRPGSVIEDQHLGGAIMIVGGSASYLVGGLWLVAGLLRDRRPRREVGR